VYFAQKFTEDIDEFKNKHFFNQPKWKNQLINKNNKKKRGLAVKQLRSKLAMMTMWSVPN